MLSGFTAANAGESDSAILLQSLELDVCERNIADISPWRLTAPLSPDMAASREGRSLDLSEIVAFCRKAQDGPEDVLLIEGVGGAMVPLGGTHTVMDWMVALDVPAVVVAGSYLGTISHVLTTLTALETHGVRIEALIVSESEESPVPLDETIGTIARHAPNVTIERLPRIAHRAQPWTFAPDMTHLLEPLS